VLLGDPIARMHAAGFDQFMEETMRKYSIPGGQLAVAVKGGRFIHNRVYGFADIERKAAVRNDALFRIGSVSKTITQVAILTLVDQGRLRLTDRAVEVLRHLKPVPAPSSDPRWHEVTVLHLLKHQAGFESIEAMFPPWSREAAKTAGVPEPPECETIIRYMMGRPLDYAPGAKTVYSNFGYCVLGRVVEAASGMSYEAYVRKALLRPVGIRDMRIGGSLLRERASREVRYYHQANQTDLPYLTDSAFPGLGQVPWAYGGYYLKATDAHGGWIASAQDIAKFGLAIDGQLGRKFPSLLSPASLHVLMNLPRQAGKELPPGAPFQVSHAGALQGSNAALLYRTREGVSVGITFNSLPVDYQGFFAYLMERLDKALEAAGSGG
jgi:N-acyl-D-amino-acid deacylase